ncbi:beta-ketoacyl synthase chain length factor [Serratia sp. JUb9]|uniref:beta-ketoacyl synthase chain length factor n=1 Tax=Serratia sp. JUb9 TaxID=2724469 RepID=UPI00164DE29F|nr:beta-ketoacyl synthase chain length factor [Serratia sp. JUb9]QNK31679.1 beta-ketoacyl synthase chain length factor [Serratia sp. JUb9]
MKILNWWALADGRETADSWRQWARQPHGEITTQTLPPCPHIPMMSLRRMSAGTRLAVECGLTLLEQQAVDMAIFTSRHGELERTHKILQHLNQQQPLSPTDFAMSVHNTAAGWLTIIAKNTLPTTSLAAGEDSFQQGILEAQGILASGAAERVLLVDFDGALPEDYQPFVTLTARPYALALLLAAGESLQCVPVARQATAESLPQSLSFLRHWLSGQTEFIVPGPRHDWRWTYDG